MGEARSIGLVLSGGGIKGMAHIGLLKALDEAHIKISHISGASIGAIVGALYANGTSIAEMMDFFRYTPLFKYNFYSVNKPGFINTHHYKSIFQSYIENDSFESLSIRLNVVATDLFEGNTVCFNKGELITPVLASSALPPFFSPIEIQGRLYADGGITNNFPVEYITAQCDYVIGSNVVSLRTIDEKELHSSWQLMTRATKLLMYSSNKNRLALCDLLIQPAGLDQIGVLDKKGIERAFEIGYQNAIETLGKKLDFIKIQE